MINWRKIRYDSEIPPIIWEHIINPAIFKVNEEFSGKLMSVIPSSVMLRMQQELDQLSSDLLKGTIYKFSLSAQNNTEFQHGILKLDILEMITDYDN